MESSTAHRAHASTEGVTSIFLKAAVCWLPHAEGYFAKKLAEFTTTKGVTTIIGGGDFVAAVEKAGLADKMSHIFLPGVLCLDEA
ncbi:unnamed protein product [Miscanthus lutarioriparius]|uniref:phosphoglycerate kinase n=1 Tax=Miscanthus lutarioriparius TaxID=422564 RepID=A0A811RU23_9POAL|nr:unnamed protein product [Miscanthus lutarioriparius]